MATTALRLSRRVGGGGWACEPQESISTITTCGPSSLSSSPPPLHLLTLLLSTSSLLLSTCSLARRGHAREAAGCKFVLVPSRGREEWDESGPRGGEGVFRRAGWFGSRLLSSTCSGRRWGSEFSSGGCEGVGCGDGRGGRETQRGVSTRSRRGRTALRRTAPRRPGDRGRSRSG